MARYTVCLREHRDNIDYNRLKADAQKLQVADPSLSFDAAIAKATENVIAELKAQEAEIMALLGEEPSDLSTEQEKPSEDLSTEQVKGKKPEMPDDADLRGFKYFLVKDGNVLSSGANPSKADPHEIYTGKYLKSLADGNGLQVFVKPNDGSVREMRDSKDLIMGLTWDDLIHLQMRKPGMIESRRPKPEALPADAKMVYEGKPKAQSPEQPAHPQEAKPKKPVEKKPKELWEKTSAEAGEHYLRTEVAPRLRDELAKAKKAPKPFGVKNKAEYLKDLEAQLHHAETATGDEAAKSSSFVDHYPAVRKALSEGKPVPPEVLKDYPDLQPAPPKEAERTVEPEAKGEAQKAEPAKVEKPKRKKPEAKTEDKTPKAESAAGRGQAEVDTERAQKVLEDIKQLPPFKSTTPTGQSQYEINLVKYLNKNFKLRNGEAKTIIKSVVDKATRGNQSPVMLPLQSHALAIVKDLIAKGHFNKELSTDPEPDTPLQKDTPDKQRGMKPEALVAMLPPYAKRMMKEGKLVVVKDAAEAQAYSGQKIPDTSQGFYYPRQDRVVLIANMASSKENLMMVLNHELLHRAEFVDPDVKATMKRLDDQFFERFKLAKLGKGTAAEREAYRRIAYSTSPKEFHMLEFRAYLVSEYNKDPNSLTGYIKKLVQDFIAAIRIGLMRAGVSLKELTAADMNRIAETYGAQAYRRAEGEVTLFSNTAVDELWQELNTQPSTYLSDFKIKSKKGLGKAIETKDDLFYAALTQNQLVDLLEEILPEGRQFAKERNNYDVEESNWHNRADEIAKRWENIVEADHLIRSEKNRQQLRLEQAKIADWMHESTTSGIDARLPRPKDTGKNGIELHKYDQLKAKWDNLSADSRKLINDVDKFHQDVTARLLDTLTDKVEQAEIPKETKAEIIKEIKDKFNKVQGPYFPLMRTGDYWIDHADGVEMFETEIEWKAAKKALKEKGTPVYGSGKSLKNFNRVEGVDANFLESVNDLIDTVADEDQANALKDGVFQLYLQALPENSMRKRMIHRKNTPGWEKDALRSFSRKAFHDGKQLAKLRFAPAMRRVLTDISNTVRYAESDKRYAMLKDRVSNVRDAIALFEQGIDFDTIAAKFNDDTEALRPIRRFSRFKDEIDRDQAMTEYLKQQESLLDDVDKFRELDFENKETRAANLLKALNKSYENMMKPSGNAASHFINQTVFTWMLGFNPGSALINLSQVPFVSAPVMAGRHSFQSTNRAFWKAYKDFIGGKEPNGDDMGIYSKLDDNERKMYEALTENGLFDRTRAHDLAGFGDEGVARGTLIRTFMGWSTYLFHKAEVMNREVTALMAFRLEYKKTGSLRQAIDYADRIVRDTHFDYAAANRPDLFQGNFRRVAFQFKMYSQGVTYLWGKTFRDAFITKLKTPEQKAEAKRIFFSMVGTQMIAAGAMGLPIGGILMGAQMAASAFDDDDDPIDVEVEIRKALTYMFGDTVGKIIAKGPLSAATGLDFHSRMSLSDLWIREPDKELEGKDTAYYLLKTAFGPAGGLLEDVFVGGKLWGEGNKERAVEKWLPHSVSSLAKAGRMIEEGGASTLSGEMLYEMNAIEKAFQAGGLRSLGLSERQEQNAAFKNRESAVGATKLKLLHAAVNAKMKGDNEAFKEAMDVIKEFNAKYPQLRITPASIIKSIKTRKKNKANTKEGLVVKPKYEFIRDEENFL
jgi:hypothetical protein